MQQRVTDGLDDLYEAPHAPAEDDAAARAEAASRLRRRALVLFGVACAGLVGAIAVGAVAPRFFAGTACVALAGAAHGVASLGRPRSARGVVASASLVVANLGMAAVGALAAWLSTVTFSRGRQIRRLGAILLPPVTAGDAWSKRTVDLVEAPLDIDDDARAALAAQWRENGRTEHASVAAFAKLTLDLVALGAPPELVAKASRDTLDEIRHAETCFALARAIDGRALAPGPFPEARAVPRSRPRTLMLAALAVDSLVDGAMNEGLSARVVTRLAKRCAHPEIRAILRAIAADEGRHAAHGWDVVRFCLAEGGAPVAHALAAAARALPRELRAPASTAEASRDGGWERWGIAGACLEAEELAQTRADVLRRVAVLVAPYVGRAARASAA